MCIQLKNQSISKAGKSANIVVRKCKLSKKQKQYMFRIQMQIIRYIDRKWLHTNKYGTVSQHVRKGRLLEDKEVKFFIQIQMKSKMGAFKYGPVSQHIL